MLMNKWQSIATLLGVYRKIEDQGIRMAYFKERWGLDQNIIAEIEDVSQSKVSRGIKAAKLVNGTDMSRLYDTVTFIGEEIQLLHALPRTVLSDLELLSFVYDILEVRPNAMPMFYNLAIIHEKARATALFNMGIMSKFLAEKFGKRQNTFSMFVKSGMETIDMDMILPDRYHKLDVPWTLVPKFVKSMPTKLFMAGGQG